MKKKSPNFLTETYFTIITQFSIKHNTKKKPPTHTLTPLYLNFTTTYCTCNLKIFNIKNRDPHNIQLLFVQLLYICEKKVQIQ